MSNQVEVEQNPSCYFYLLELELSLVIYAETRLDTMDDHAGDARRSTTVMDGTNDITLKGGFVTGSGITSMCLIIRNPRACFNWFPMLLDSPLGGFLFPFVHFSYQCPLLRQSSFCAFSKALLSKLNYGYH